MSQSESDTYYRVTIKSMVQAPDGWRCAHHDGQGGVDEIPVPFFAIVKVEELWKEGGIDSKGEIVEAGDRACRPETEIRAVHLDQGTDNLIEPCEGDLKLLAPGFVVDDEVREDARRALEQVRKQQAERDRAWILDNGRYRKRKPEEMAPVEDPS